MTKAVKGALLSGLVLPGLGQIVLKQYRRGVVLMLTVLVGIAVIIVKAVQQAVKIFDSLVSTGDVIDADAISLAVSQSTALSDSVFFNLLQIVIVICWIYGIIDAYKIGKQQDLNPAESRKH